MSLGFSRYLGRMGDPEAFVEMAWTAAGLFTFIVTWLFVLSVRQ